MTTILTRLARAGQRLAAAAPADYSAHWKRVNDERMRDLEALAELIPDSHADAFLAAARAVAPRLFVDGPAWEPEESPALQRWLMTRAGWGRDHPCNPPFPGPVPAAYLDLLLAHPDTGSGHTCGGYGIPVSSTRASGEPGVGYRRPEPLAAECPVCGIPVPPRRA
jgi:hypothetical protein